MIQQIQVIIPVNTPTLLYEANEVTDLYVARGTIYLGDETVSSTNGFQTGTNEVVLIKLTDGDKLYGYLTSASSIVLLVKT